MVKRRLSDPGLPSRLSPHSFRVMTITGLLAHGSEIDEVQYVGGHADSRTTALHDRRKKLVTRNIVERISIRIRERDDRARAFRPPPLLHQRAGGSGSV
jgi:integrase